MAPLNHLQIRMGQSCINVKIPPITPFYALLLHLDDTTTIFFSSIQNYATFLPRVYQLMLIS